MNVKRGLNSAAKPGSQFNCNITFETYGKIIAVNIHGNDLFFAIKNTDN